MAFERTVPERGEEVTFFVTPDDKRTEPSPPVHELHIVISAVDPQWGPKHTRIEGFTVHDGEEHGVYGYVAFGKTSESSIGRIEIHFNEP